MIGAPIFLYGTLLDPRVLARSARDPRIVRRMMPATLTGHARVVLRGTPYPTLLAWPGENVEGRVIRPSAATLRALSAYEGASYRLLPIKVVWRRGPLRARAWVSPRWRADAGRRWAPRRG